MGTVTFNIPSFSHAVNSDRVLSVQFDYQMHEGEGATAQHETNVRSLFIAEANHARNAEHTARVATHLRELANDLDALAVKWKPAPKEPDTEEAAP